MNKKRALALLISMVIFANAFWALIPISHVNALSEFTPVVYNDTFDYDAFSKESSPFDSAAWQAEDPSSGNGQKFYATEPIVEDGVMKMSEGMSAQFNWTKLDGFTFDKTKTYTLTFDVKITDFGDDVGSINAVWKRELYVAPGGWFNQIELISDGANCIRTGDTWCGTKGVEYKTDVVYTIVVVWEPSANKITSTLKNGSTVISTGSRTNTAYSNADSYLSNWVMRCEEGSVEIDNLSYTDGSVTYTQSFDYNANDKAMTDSGIWAIESLEVNGASAPELVNGVLTFTEKDSVVFNWTKVPGVKEYDPQNSYIFEFDAKITDAGDGSDWGGGNPAQTRALFVAMGGYYNQLELPNADFKVRAGDTYQAFDQNVYLNKTVRIRIVWEGTIINTSVYDESGALLINGSRTNASYTDMTNHVSAMTYIAMRCEDGAVELDNFVFKVERVQNASSTALNISETQSAVYECKIQNTVDQQTTLKLNGNEVVYLDGGTMRLCGSAVGGNYGSGEYKVKIYVNKAQNMVSVEVTLPDSGTVRRGLYSLIDISASAYSIDAYAVDSTKISDVNVSYTDNNVNDYQLTTTEPVYEGFGANVFNLITSFNDPTSTRNFAWTAQESYIGDAAMAIRYRVKGENNWTVADAIRENEANVNATQNYYKVDIANLSADTEYEYKIGKKDSTNETADWSKTYTFKTAKKNVNEFSFIAVGDTQGVTWNGSTVSTKGFMFAKAAYEEAFKEVQDAAFILHTGDVVEWGANSNQWNMFFKALGDFGAITPHFAAIGNHDIVSIGATAPEFYFDLHFNHPNNGGTAALDKNYTDQITDSNLAGIAANADETVYSYNYGDAHFIVLNSGNYSADDMYILEAQRAWLEEDLKANANAKWTVIIVHEPVYHRYGGSESRPWLYDLIEEYNVDLMIQGHSHLVTRTYPMKDGKIVSKENIDVIRQGDGTVYTTIGSTAYNHDILGNPNAEECAIITTTAGDQPSYTVVTVSDEKLVMTVKQINGLVIDSFTIMADESQACDHSNCTKTYTDVTEEGHVATWSCGEIDTADTEHNFANGDCACGAVCNHNYVNGVCDVCGYGCTHNGGKATCKTKAVCTVCGQAYGDLDTDNHEDAEGTWTKTENGHSFNRTCCDSSDVAMTDHTYDAGVCTVCDYECVHNGGKATCKTKAVCDSCGVSYGDLDPDNHEDAEGTWTKTENGHSFNRTCCDATDVATEGHTYGNDSVCDDCGYGCTHKGGKATCKTKAVCDSCGVSYGNLDANNHEDAEGTWTKTEDGHSFNRTCCDATDVATEDHTYGNDSVCDECDYECAHKGGEATCEDKATCTVCGQEYGDYADHDYKDGKCTVCDEADPDYVAPDTSDRMFGLATLIAAVAAIGIVLFPKKRTAK